MARYLGPGAELTDPESQDTFVTQAAEAWRDEAGLRPPAYMIGIGGFGVTYRAVGADGAVVALKEYFPREFAKRSTEGQVMAKAAEGSARIFREGLKRFLLEGRLLTAFDHPGINKVTHSFELDGTAYHVSPLIEGREQLGASETGAALIERRVTLEHYLRDVEATDGAVVDLNLLRPILEQLLDAVEYVHTEGAAIAREITGEDIAILLHRDIKPSNILVEPPDDLRDAPAIDILRHPDTRLLLIDFGSARVIRDEDDVTRTIGVVTEAYAPPELRDNHIESQGAQTDIYSLAALIWRAFQGRPPSGTDLLSGARLETLVRPMPGEESKTLRAPLRFLQAVDRGLQQQASRRPQSIAEWRQDLFSEAPDAAPAAGTAAPGPATASDRKDRAIKPWMFWAGGGLAAAAAGIYLMVSNGEAALERRLIDEAERAYNDARTAAERGESLSLEAETFARNATSEAEQAVAWGDEGEARYARYEASLKPLEVYHGWNAGSSYYGDIAIGGYWCHKKGPNIRPSYAYSTYSGVAAAAIVYNVPGYSCGPSHTHLIPQTFSESKNPWKVTGDSFVFHGQVDPELRPSGLGQMLWAESRLVGRVANVESGQSWLGEAFLGDILNTRIVGKMLVNPGTSDDIDNFTAEIYFGSRLLFRGRKEKDSYTGMFAFSNEKRVFGKRVSEDQIMGRLSLSDGVTWVGVFSTPESTTQSPARAWGRLEQGGRIFWGQAVDGSPSGCGVWVETNGDRKAGYFEGSNRLADRSSECQGVTYVAPVGPEGETP